MVRKRTDSEMVAHLLDRLKLVVALSEDIAIEAKLHIQPMLADMADILTLPEPEQERARVGAYYDSVVEAASDDPNAEALLGAVREFVTYL